ncbi:hypothetical protein H8I69_14830 [Serratia fonticola]|uniref:hypothetical protein n=1 Tax=Serratia fonticola TaxID=47917 RepID=UPI0015C6255A|nr:hypothetical protein [Serratia fonticola]MBC3380389.1 hypothetical protein [Serratia fonticola]NYA39588.1 hypothetical protein [Serratia fonticola]
MSSSVHTIRARSEDIAEYRRSMACLGALMQQWEALNRQNSAADPLTLEQVRQRYQKLQRNGTDNISRHSAESFASLTEQIPGMIAFIRQEIAQLHEVLIEQHTQQRQQQRALKTSTDAELALRQTLLATSQQPPRLTEEQQALAQRLKSPQPELVANHPYAQHPASERLGRIDRHIAELAIVDPQWDISAFVQRAAELDRRHQDTQWNMLSDSLTLELAEATHAARALAEQRQQLGLLIAGLGSYQTAEANALIEKLNLVLTSRELPLLLEAITTAQAATEQQRKNIAALARREAVLAGLAKLGYEVHESDAQTWSDDGKVVIGKPATPGYGLELAGAQGSERFQVRAVAFSEQRDTQRDSDIESIWCGEQQKLEQLLQQTGDALTLERALPAGASQLKVAKPANTLAEQADYRYREKNSRSLD